MKKILIGLLISLLISPTIAIGIQTMPVLTVAPNPAPTSSVVSVTGSGFSNSKTRLLLDGYGATTNIFRPKKDGSFSVGITVSSVPKTQVLIAQQQSGITWTEKARTTIVVQTSSEPLTVISAQATNIQPTTAIISWTLSGAGTGQVEYGQTTTYGLLSAEASNYTFITDLIPSTLYHFRIKAKSSTGIISYSGDYTFTTTAIATPTPTPTPNPTPTPTPTGANLADYGGNWSQALAAAPSKGNLIYVPAGTWPSPVIRPYAGLTIKGAGPTLTFLTRIGVPTAIDVGFLDVRVTDVVIKDLTIRGTLKTNPGAGDDILIYGVGSHRLKVQNVTLEDANGIGWQTQDATGMLWEDITIRNIGLRNNGYHGVAAWPYHGTKTSIFRRMFIDGADFAGLFLDAGTSVGTASSVDDNTFEDITIMNAARRSISWATGAGIMLTGAKNNSFLRTTITDQLRGAAFAFGIDQSGLNAQGNFFRQSLIARISSGNAIVFDPAADGNTFDGGSGAGRVINLSGNVVINWPELTN